MSTFPEYLHSLDDDQLRALIRSRPDAFFPTPPSSGSLATRLSLPGSASRALRQLSAADLAVLEKLADAGAELDPVDASGFDDVGTCASLPWCSGRSTGYASHPARCPRFPQGGV